MSRENPFGAAAAALALVANMALAANTIDSIKVEPATVKAGSPVTITVTVADQTSFTPTIDAADPGHTAIAITNEGVADILLAGNIHNPYGATTITSLHGNILSVNGSAIQE